MANNWNQGLAWSEEFETGYADIDDQHKKLFQLTSNLIESCQKGEKVSINKTLSFLVNYTVEHFADEEKISKLYRYPDFDGHKELHDKFKETVGAFVEQYEKNGDSEELFGIVNKVIVTWLIRHIQLEDFKIAQHIKKLERGR
jgi:hemerythrin